MTTPEAMLGDDEAGSKAQNLAGFGEDHLHQRGVLVRGARELPGPAAMA